MIAFLRGTVVEVNESRAVLEVNGMGYNVLISSRDAQLLRRGTESALVHTYLQVREDAMQLFGFLNREDLEVFKLVLCVNGIGPKAALGILSVFSANDLRFAVLAGDAKTISKAPGIGGKTAQKLILELKDKFSLEEAFEEKLEQSPQTGDAGEVDENRAEAVQALVALGYSGSDALRAVRAVDLKDGMTTEDILRASLKNL
ncbi:MAG: Holliday junction branch migration protein RuvA [Eubacteriales bacterium]|nr:Holliday junction branch migration protein RuvA [Eubacteriales bacterium]